jgi:histidyl-tRNA synthetase
MLALLDRKEKIDNFEAEAKKIAGGEFILPEEVEASSHLSDVIQGLKELGIQNVVFSPSTVRGFTYYTGTIFEIFDTSNENNRSLLGGGRYDNLTALFGGDAISGIGFGMGDVTMRDFLETHNLLTSDITAPQLMIIPTDTDMNIEALRLAQHFRSEGISTAVDTSDRKIGKKIEKAAESFVSYALILGEDEVRSKRYALKNLEEKAELTGTLTELVANIAQ